MRNKGMQLTEIVRIVHASIHSLAYLLISFMDDDVEHLSAHQL